MGLVNKPELLALTESLAPAGTVAFWIPEAEMEALELELGTGIRLKTRGDGPFLGKLGSFSLNRYSWAASFCGAPAHPAWCSWVLMVAR